MKEFAFCCTKFFSRWKDFKIPVNFQENDQQTPLTDVQIIERNDSVRKIRFAKVKLEIFSDARCGCGPKKERNAAVWVNKRQRDQLLAQLTHFPVFVERSWKETRAGFIE